MFIYKLLPSFVSFDTQSNTILLIQVPVYRGCCKSLSVSDDGGDTIHGTDGLGEVASNYSPCEQSYNNKHAVAELLELVNKHPGTCLCALLCAMNFSTL